MILPGAGDRCAQQRLVLVDRLDDGRAEEQELEVLRGGVAGVEQVQPGVGAHRPVVVLARAVDAGERLLVQQADQAVAASRVLQDLHRDHLVVGADVRVLEDRRDLELVGRDLVVARLDRHAQLRQLELDVEHVREDPLGDRAEVVVVELVALRGLRAEQRASGRQQVGALEEVLLVDQEVLLLAAGRREHPLGVLDPEQLERAHGGAGERVHRAQQRDLVVERLARPRGERRRDAEQRAVRVLEDERRAGRVPGGVAAGLEGRADAAGRERGCVGLALDQLLAGELGDRGAIAGRAVEGVVLLGGRAGERLEPVRVVGGAFLHRPFLHRLRDGVGERGVERLAAGEGSLQRLVDVLGQAVALQRRGEDVGAEHLVVGKRQVGRPERGAVGAPLRGGDVLLAGPWHELSRFLLRRGGLGVLWRGAERKAIVVPSESKGITEWRNRSADLSTAGQSARDDGRARLQRSEPARLRPRMAALPAAYGLRLRLRSGLSGPRAARSARPTGWPGSCPLRPCRYSGSRGSAAGPS